MKLSLKIMSALLASAMLIPTLTAVQAASPTSGTAETKNTEPYVLEIDKSTKYYTSGTDYKKMGAYELVSEEEFPKLKIVQGRTIIPRDRLLEWLDEKTRYDKI